MPLKIMRTVKSIEWTVAGATAIGASYSLIRFVISGYTVASTGRVPVIETAEAGLLWSGLLLISSILVALGLITDNQKLKKNGWFIMAACRMLQVIGHIVIMGPVPFTWLYPATLLVIMIILYMHASLTVDRSSKK